MCKAPNFLNYSFYQECLASQQAIQPNEHGWQSWPTGSKLRTKMPEEENTHPSSVLLWHKLCRRRVTIFIEFMSGIGVYHGVKRTKLTGRRKWGRRLQSPQCLHREWNTYMLLGSSTMLPMLNASQNQNDNILWYIRNEQMRDRPKAMACWRSLRYSSRGPKGSFIIHKCRDHNEETPHHDTEREANLLRRAIRRIESSVRSLKDGKTYSSKIRKLPLEWGFVTQGLKLAVIVVDCSTDDCIERLFFKRTRHGRLEGPRVRLCFRNRTSRVYCPTQAPILLPSRNNFGKQVKEKEVLPKSIEQSPLFVADHDFLYFSQGVMCNPSSTQS